ncbi:MAG: PaaI family thioesterase [candidate division WOR-3 bacterium]
MNLLEYDNYCFACGKENPRGLKLNILKKGNEAIIEFTPDKSLQGFSNILHGGIIATLLDEAMAHAVSLSGYWGVTAKLEVKFKKIVEVGKTIVITGKLIELRDDWAIAEASISYKNSNDPLATATGTFKLLKKD